MSSKIDEFIIDMFRSINQARKIYGVANSEKRNPEVLWNELVETLAKHSSATQTSPQLDEEGNEIEDVVPKIPTDVELKENSYFKIPAKIDLFTGLDVTEKDNIFVSWSTSFRPFSKALFVNNENVVVGFFEIKTYSENGEKKNYLTAKAENINFAGLKNTKCCFLFCDALAADSSKMELFKVPIEVEFHETEETPTHLCIDFGTSNTTAGCYLDENYVKNISNLAIINKNVVLNSENVARFIDKVRVNDKDDLDAITYRNIVPTIVYVADCADPDNVEYLFGYDAARVIKDDNYCPKATCFMEIKRWTSNLDSEVTIEDSCGNKAVVSRTDVVAKFLLYVIRTAENQFKCKFKNVHITSPVKLKNVVLEEYGKILSDNGGYKLEKKNAIDEGFAVLYGIIDNQIKEGTYENKEEKKALIIDCGGGTSDLASCKYTIDKDDDGVINLDITTEYLNGEVNFGGNNLTYRIMQYMKIVYVHKMKTNERKNIDELIKIDSNVLFSYIEGEFENDDETKVKNRYEEIYRGISEAYAEAEKVIPTRFGEYENQPKEVYDKVKNNFFFLWKLADEMKKEFYRSTTISRYTFKHDDDNRDIDLHVARIENWRLSILEDGRLTEQSYPDITFTAKEIDKLLRADIYYLVRKFLNDLYMEKDPEKSLDSYNQIKLSGQSSKINIFKDSLKEFLPGKKIKSGRIDSKENDAEELKLLCLKGAIMFLRSLETSNIEVKLKNETQNIPFSVYFKTQNDEEKEMIKQGKNWKQPANKGRITTSGKVVHLFMRNTDKEISRPYQYACENIRYSATTFEAIKKLSFGLISQEEIDNLPADKKYFFVYLNKKDWGFNIAPIYRDGEGKLYKGKAEFCSFETDILQESFFDGKK